MKLPALSGRELIKNLEEKDFVAVGQKGSHVKLRRIDNQRGAITLIVPLHKTLKRGTLRAILRQAGLTPTDLL